MATATAQPSATVTATAPPTSTAPSRSASRSTSPSSSSRRSTAGAPIRSRCSPMPATTSATSSAWSSPGPVRSPAGSRPTSATPTAGSGRRSWPRSPTRCCCWSRSARSPGRRSAGSRRRRRSPPTRVMVVAAIGIVVNGATALLFLRGSHDDLNARGAFLHMAADAAVSAGVVVAAALTLWLGWTWLDPAASLAIALVILLRHLGLVSRLAAPHVRWRADLDRPRSRPRRARGAARRRLRQRPARLGHRDDRGRPDRAPGDARRPPRRRVLPRAPPSACASASRSAMSPCRRTPRR